MSLKVTGSSSNGEKIGRWGELGEAISIPLPKNVTCSSTINGAKHELKYNSSDYLDIDSHWRVPELATQPELGLWP
jgi:hypothetical protein